MNSFLSLSILMLSTICFSQCHDSEDLIGVWRSPTEDDCPDFVEFKPEGVYHVYNICTSDFSSGIVEKGKWHFNLTENIIVLENRNYISMPSLFIASYGEKEIIIFKVKLISSDFIIISSTLKDGSSKVEKYVKVRSVI